MDNHLASAIKTKLVVRYSLICLASAFFLAACMTAKTQIVDTEYFETPIAENSTQIISTETLLPATPFPEIIISENGCSLPCWWGIVPGKTSWNKATALLEPFYEEINFSHHKDETMMASVFFLPEYSGFKKGLNKQEFYINDGTVTYIKTKLNTDSMLLTEFIEHYGIPDIVYLSTPSTIFSDFSTTYYIVYSDLGFSFQFVAAINWDAEKIEMCPNPYYFIVTLPPDSWSPIDYPPTLIAWDPTINTVLDFISMETIDEDIVPLEEISGLTFNDFIDVYNSDSECIKLKKDYWENADFMMEQIED